MSELLIPSFLWAMCVNCSGRSLKMSNVSKSLRSLTKNERPWAICSGGSGRSEEMSDHERIAQVAYQNEQMSESLVFLSQSLMRSFLGKKLAIRSENRWAKSQPWMDMCRYIILYVFSGV